MNWKPYLTGILILGLLGCQEAPSQFDDTTDQLNQAICLEDWDSAIAILDDVISDYPNSQNTLAEYRDRLQQLSETGLSEIHKLDYDCTNESIPKVEETPLSDRVESYNEQINPGMSYAEVATIVGRPGKINDLYSYYLWRDEHGNFLSARFSDDQLDNLNVDEIRDCEDNNPRCVAVDITTPVPATEFKEIAARFEEGMNDRAVLEQLLQELGEPALQTDSVHYEWQFAEATDPDPNNCTLSVSFDNDSSSLNQAYCLYDDR
ncbi:tetratricopeptide repeat protein [Roseofilum sp. BLCC_M91]|uniref:Tetratricopeptide repeat protein n=1 Tax=Roseofilum halophilum BLCC-M91 TaxID=3022259 RepID=A0ABT7BPY8_9CYAN|nr:tetratricopeptide repeat protein [Roseofilum halophilum]MDJ1181260.1 tetratricopeptide repeat protein [Roseofilum halophilum BLCC-M91]